MKVLVAAKVAGLSGVRQGLALSDAEKLRAKSKDRAKSIFEDGFAGDAFVNGLHVGHQQAPGLDAKAEGRVDRDQYDHGAAKNTKRFQLFAEFQVDHRKPRSTQFKWPKPEQSQGHGVTKAIRAWEVSEGEGDNLANNFIEMGRSCVTETGVMEGLVVDAKTPGKYRWEWKKTELLR